MFSLLDATIDMYLLFIRTEIEMPIKQVEVHIFLEFSHEKYQGEVKMMSDQIGPSKYIFPLTFGGG